MSKKINLAAGIDLEFATPDRQSFFFGYYNYSPISKDGTKMLAHRAQFEGRDPKADDEVEIGYFDLVTKKWHKFGNSRAFNWQQGSMLQWLGPDYNSQFIFNDVHQNKFIARIVDLKKKTSRVIPNAIYAVDPQGKFSISLIFERCYWTRAYSYSNIINEKWNERIHPDDGILRVDLETGQAKVIIGIQKILNFANEKDNSLDAHWFEHIMMNPKGNRFAFFHRFGTNLNFSTKAYTADINGKNIWQHNYKCGDRFSHLGWRDNESYVLYTIPENNMQKSWKNFEEKNKKTKFYISLYRRFFKPLLPRKIVKKIINSKNNYTITTDQHGIDGYISSKMLSSDGHPSFTKDSRFMLTDTYEDEKGYRQLLLYDFNSKKAIQLGSIYSTFNSCGWRADLHPRFSHDEKYIVIDSSLHGHHQMLVLKINWEQIIKKFQNH